MKFLTFVSLAICSVVILFLAGCGHNSITYGDGFGFSTTLDPSTYTFGVRFVYGKVLSAVTRDNVKITMNGSGSGGSSTSVAPSTNTSGKAEGAVTIEIGHQITGYTVDALKQGATMKEIDAYVNGDSKEFSKADSTVASDLIKGDSTVVSKTDSGISSDTSK